MSANVVAGPGLLSVRSCDPKRWLSRVRDWEALCRHLDLRLRVASDCWDHADSPSDYPRFDLLRDLFRDAGTPGLEREAIVLFGALQNRLEAVACTSAVLNWGSSGCIGAHPAVQLSGAAVRAAAATGGAEAYVAGADVRETELADVDQFSSSGPVRTRQLILTCTPTGQDLAEAANVSDFMDRPHVAVHFAAARVGAMGLGRNERFRLLPQLVESLARVPTDVATDAISMMGQLLLPIEERPSGLREHELRTSDSTDSEQKKGTWGDAFRAQIRKHGSGWRLHYWRGKTLVTFSNIAPHNSLEIYD